jgi:hypothetical protein
MLQSRRTHSALDADLSGFVPSFAPGEFCDERVMETGQGPVCRETLSRSRGTEGLDLERNCYWKLAPYSLSGAYI